MSARIISTVGRTIDVIVAGRVVSHLRFAAGVCVLAAALLMGGAGGAVAVADPNSSGSAAHGDAGTTASGQRASTGAKGPKKAPGGTDSEDGRLGSAPQPGQQPSGAKGPKKAVPNVGAPARTAAAPARAAAAPAPAAAAPARAAAAPAPAAAAPAPAAAAPAPAAAAPAPAAAAPAPAAAAPAPAAAAPVTNVVAAETRKKGRTAVASTGSPGWSHVPVAGRPAAIVTPPPHPQLPTEQHRPGSPESSRNTGVATLGRTTFGATTSLPGMAPPASNGAIPVGVRSFLRHALPDLPVAVSLAALAAVALPAVGVLVILTLAGVRVGYREAIADFALRTAGIARFARRRPGQGAAAVDGRARDRRGGVLPRLASRPATDVTRAETTGRRPRPARRLARAGDMSARIISTVGRTIDVIVAGRLVSHLRFAAGVCVLAAALLMASAGGAVAVADPNSSGSAAHGDGGTNASGQGGTTARSPVGDVTGTLRETIQRVTSTLGSGRQPGQQPFHRREKPGGSAWRHGHHGREVGPGPRRAVPHRGAGSRCGGAGSRAVRASGAGSRCGGPPVPDAGGAGSQSGRAGF